MAPHWRGGWISYEYNPASDLGVFVFRNRFALDQIPKELLARVTADNRYKLFVNGELVAFGPQRGDVLHWHYETVDLAPHLRIGKNEVVALVWNFGWMAPMAQVSVRTGFLFDLLGDSLPHLNTPGDWEVARLPDWKFAMMHSGIEQFYTDIGPGEVIDGRTHPDSQNPAAGALEWRKPHGVSGAKDRGDGDSTPWNLVARSIPLMDYRLRKDQPLIRRGFHGDTPGGADREEFKSGKVIPKGSKLLLDYEALLCAYPRLRIQGPAGSEAHVTYSEGTWPDTQKSPWSDDQPRDRSEVKDRIVRGYQDKFLMGSGPCTFEPLWWRTYRYLMIEAVDADLTLENIQAWETGYPITVESEFDSSDPSLQKIWDVAVRTVRRCAGETYFDCPYYEQLQYVGDTRIQALIGYYLGKDRQLQRNAVETLGWSRMSNGITRSRYPDRQPQVIPPFSLWWVLMRQDQRLYDRLENADQGEVDEEGLNVVNAYRRLSQEPAERTFWCFGDWVKSWRSGVPPGGATSTMHLLNMYLAELATETFLDHPEARGDRRKSLQKSILGEFVKSNGLVKHRRDAEWMPSEHSETLYRLIQQRLGMPMDPWPTHELAKASAAQTTYYFSYYRHLAMNLDDYIAELDPWRDMLKENLSTFAENPPPVRSDCHAWSAHPILGFFQIVAGVTSIEHGWKRARIAPNPGSLKQFDARIGHLDGELRVKLEAETLEIDSPVPILLEWQGKRQSMPEGRHRIG